jgi:SAM-dependent methyltransferase
MARLELTGERTAPGWDHERYWFMRHEVVYRWFAGRSGIVADIGSGEGFGAEVLRTNGAHVFAVELDVLVCGHSRRTYPDVPIVCANAIALPLRDDAVDVAISCQTIEHLWDVTGYLHELRRIAARGVVITTPNRMTFSPGLGRGRKPTNPFHVQEFDAEQMLGFLADWKRREVLGLHHGARICAWEAEHGSIVPQLVESAISQRWSEPLLSFQASITIDDFVITPTVDQALDLIAIGMDA